MGWLALWLALADVKTLLTKNLEESICKRWRGWSSKKHGMILIILFFIMLRALKVSEAPTAEKRLSFEPYLSETFEWVIAKLPWLSTRSVNAKYC